MFESNSAFMQSFIDKRHRVFKVLLTILTIVEFVLMLRGFFLFNLKRLKLVLYLSSYIFLFISSLGILLILLLLKDREKHIKKLIIGIYIYAFCLIMWSTVITCIDCYANGDSGFMVYIMTCISVGTLIIIKPAVFTLYMILSGALSLTFTAIMRGWQPYSSGFYINFIVFFALAIFINIHNYQLSKREYEATTKLKRLSYIDQLTGVRNRRGFDEQFCIYSQSNNDFVLALVDVDSLKEINDTYGHPEGDNCLIALASELKEHFGEGVYRFGGDEFAVLSSLSADRFCASVDSINHSLKYKLNNTPLHISAGIYIAKAGSIEEAVKCADKALYRAKSEGKAKWVIYE